MKHQIHPHAQCPASGASVWNLLSHASLQSRNSMKGIEWVNRRRGCDFPDLAETTTSPPPSPIAVTQRHHHHQKHHHHQHRKQSTVNNQPEPAQIPRNRHPPLSGFTSHSTTALWPGSCSGVPLRISLDPSILLHQEEGRIRTQNNMRLVPLGKTSWLILNHRKSCFGILQRSTSDPPNLLRLIHSAHMDLWVDRARSLLF